MDCVTGATLGTGTSAMQTDNSYSHSSGEPAADAAAIIVDEAALAASSVY